MIVKIDYSWYTALKEQFEAPYFAQLKEFLVAERQQYTCYPPGSKIFAAFDSTPLDKVKVVILGQDPYHEPGQAMGLSFSVPPKATSADGPGRGCCCSTPPSRCVPTVPAATNATGGKSLPTPPSRPSTTTVAAWYSCSGAATQ